jgi:hypothetical protein
MKFALGLCVAASLFLAAAAAVAQQAVPQTGVAKLFGGLEARVELFGRNQGNVTVSLRLTNTARKTIHLLLVGPAPHAVDSQGTSYAFVKSSGVAACNQLSTYHLSRCIGRPEADKVLTVPLEGWTRIEPGSSAIATFELSGNSSGAPVGGFSAVFARRDVEDQLQDDSVSEEQKRRQIQTVSVGIPAYPISFAAK